mmetsp:Transcript_105133/g.314062  ORF Transcript_105133/g.314062 Transcript_105133/m.314062 type:complete len:407 (+) Transcript_105133:83-1303(+)
MNGGFGRGGAEASGLTRVRGRPRRSMCHGRQVEAALRLLDIEGPARCQRQLSEPRVRVSDQRLEFTRNAGVQGLLSDVLRQLYVAAPGDEVRNRAKHLHLHRHERGPQQRQQRREAFHAEGHLPVVPVAVDEVPQGSCSGLLDLPEGGGQQVHEGRNCAAVAGGDLDVAVRREVPQSSRGHVLERRTPAAEEVGEDADGASLVRDCLGVGVQRKVPEKPDRRQLQVLASGHHHFHRGLNRPELYGLGAVIVVDHLLQDPCGLRSDFGLPEAQGPQQPRQVRAEDGEHPRRVARQVPDDVQGHWRQVGDRRVESRQQRVGLERPVGQSLACTRGGMPRKLAEYPECCSLFRSGAGAEECYEDREGLCGCESSCEVNPVLAAVPATFDQPLEPFQSGPLHVAVLQAAE